MKIDDLAHNIPEDIKNAAILVAEYFEINGYRKWEYLNLAARNLVKDANSPNLGLATTEELIKELKARAIIGGYADYKPCRL